MQKILVFGGTGMLGKPVVKQLQKAGFDVTVASRDAYQATQILPDVKVIEADLSDEKSIAVALRGQDAVYLNLSVKQTEKITDFHTETDGIKNLLEAAKKSKLQRIAYLSSLVKNYQGQNGFNWWVFDIKNEAVSLLQSSDLPTTIFYPSCFMESLIGTQKEGSKILLVGKSSVKPYYIAGEDYGKQVAQAFRVVPAGESREYIIQGTDAITQHQAAERFVKNYTEEQLKLAIAPAFFMKLMRFFGTRFDYAYHITKALNEYDEPFLATQTWQELGKPSTGIEQFAKFAISAK